MPLGEGLRSYVDPDTNAPLIADFDPATYLSWLRGRQLAGSGVLANFLHEWTHRWCHHSRVGSTIALLKLRAAIRQLLDADALDDFVRCMTAIVMLEPMSEGLALFAEFDAYPGASPFMSQTLATAGLHFAPMIDTGDMPLRPLELLLQQLRRDPDQLARKAAIYVEPNAYQVGYLSVKALWGALAAACPKLGDRDLFLAYLRSYVYDDPGLVVAILAPAHSELHASERIANHLLQRVKELLDFAGLCDRVDRWIDSADSGSVDVSTIGATAGQLAETNRLFTQAQLEDFDDGASGTMCAFMTMVLEERSLCIIGRLDATFAAPRPDGSVEISAAATGAVIGAWTPAAPLAASRAELFLVATDNGHGMMLLVRIEKQVDVVATFGSCDEDAIALARRHVANSESTKRVVASLRDGLDASPLTSVWAMIERQVRGAVDAVYGPLMTLHVPEADAPAVSARLREVGLYGLLNEDGEWLRALAAVGLVNSFSINVDTIRLVGEMLDISESALEHALTHESSNGMHLLRRRGDSALALV